MDISLQDRLILVTRAAEQSMGLRLALEARGARVEELPLLTLSPTAAPDRLARALGSIATFDWLVLTSANAVGALKALEWPSGLRVAAVGESTAAALAALGHPPDLVPRRADGLGVAEALIASGLASGTRVLLPRGNLANDELPDALTAAGAVVTCVEAYRVNPAQVDGAALGARLGAGDFDWVTLTSGSAAEYLVAALPDPAVLRQTRLATLGPRTSDAVRALGLKVAAEAADRSAYGLAAAIVAVERPETEEE